VGLGKKIIIANTMGEICSIFRASDDKSVTFYWLYAIAYLFQVYFDFSGYSDMAIGLGKIFGFDFVENFNYPYISGSISEFWRRWHMTLGSWFRDYLYIPLGGNRVPLLKQIRNILVVWMFTGFWHGAAWTFIIWGAYFAVLLMIEKFWLNKYLPKLGFAKHIYVLLFVIISFVIFNSADMSQAFSDLSCMFGFGAIPAVSAEALYYLRSYGIIIIIAAIGSTPLPKLAIQKLKKNGTAERIVNILEPVFPILILTVVTAYLVDGSFNPFLYFRF